MEYSQDFDPIPTDPVRDYKGSTGDHQFARTLEPTVTPSGRVLPQNLNGFFNPINEMVCRGWVMFGHVRMRAIEVFDR
jgi:hypothetical protein